ncbi:ribosomal protein S18-alanine N-acetyltransferase [Ideonella sp. BN130291]|uniref:ribosomal protein S18-alanine N-acetyltransferase n=1 Tax=Ideonella sp. BN130291 TaxID=3112940 RepID=UPI002E26D042|nr:ribosomal protein S18-alanine N-acetyltransferase [Ideonella sp. BN130291]
MSAAWQSTAPRVVPMTGARVEAVAAIEASAYAFPWSRGNFVDSLAAGYLAEVMLGPAGEVVAYQVAMQGVDEMHLLNLTVAPTHWGRGLGRHLLDRLVLHARGVPASAVWLEVRQSNTRARRIYERYGFVQVGVRRGYYPGPQGSREDAVVMSLHITQPPEAPDGLV